MTSCQTILDVAPEEGGLRLDRLLTRHLPDMTRAKVRHLFDTDRLRVNGERPSGPVLTVQSGDRVEIRAAPHGDPETQILYDEPGFFVAYKPAGVLMARALIASRAAGPRHEGRPRPVLAVERQMSGIVVAARQPGVHHRLSRQFQSGRGRRVFTVLVRGIVPRGAGPLPDAAGWTYRLIKRYRDHALVQLMPPEPLRASPVSALSAAGWPVVSLAGPPAPAAAMHAGGVVFSHLRTGRTLRFDPPLPPRFAAALAALPPAPTLAADLPPAPASGPSAASATAAEREPALRSPRGLRHRTSLPPKKSD